MKNLKAIFLLFWFYFDMQNVSTNLNAFKQPEPEIVKNQNASKNPVFKYPNVGVLQVPTISKTPVADTIALKKKENPKTAYKVDLRNKKLLKGFNWQTFSSVAIVICGILAFLTRGKKVK